MTQFVDWVNLSVRFLLLFVVWFERKLVKRRVSSAQSAGGWASERKKKKKRRKKEASAREREREMEWDLCVRSWNDSSTAAAAFTLAHTAQAKQSKAKRLSSRAHTQQQQQRKWASEGKAATSKHSSDSSSSSSSNSRTLSSSLQSSLFLSLSSFCFPVAVAAHTQRKSRQLVVVAGEHSTPIQASLTFSLSFLSLSFLLTLSPSARKLAALIESLQDSRSLLCSA